MKIYSLDYISNLIKLREFNLVKVRLCSSVKLFPSIDKVNEFYTNLKGIISSFALKAFFLLHMLCDLSFLKNRDLILWAKNREIFCEKSLGFSVEEALKIKWTKIPIVLICRETPFLCHLVFGISPFSLRKICPKWAEDFIDNDVINRFKEFENFFKVNLYFFPLIPENTFFSGRSWELPFVLHLLSLIRDETIFSDFLATGKVDLNSKDLLIATVNRIYEKFLLSQREEFSLFLYPAGLNIGDKFSSKAIPVKSVEEAWMWIRLFNGKNFQELKKMILMDGGEGFVNNWKSLSLNSLKWFLEKTLNKSIIEDIISSKELSSRFVLDLYSMMDHSNKHLVSLVLKFLNLPIESLEKYGEDIAFMWCVLNFKKSSFVGDVKGCFFFGLKHQRNI